MKRITVDAYKIALVTKRGKLVDVWTEGKYWAGFNNKVDIYEMNQPLELSATELTILGKSDLLKNHLRVVQVDDCEIGIEMKQGKFRRVLVTGTYAYWDSEISYSVEKLDLSEIEVSETVLKYILMKPSVLQYLRVYPVESYQKGILYIDGVFEKCSTLVYITSGREKKSLR